MTTVSGDAHLRDRDDGAILEKPPEQESYQDWVGSAPVVIIPRPTYDVAKDGSVTVRDTRPDALVVETATDGAVTIRIPA